MSSSDDALLIGQVSKEADSAKAAQGSGSSGIQVPTDFRSISFFAVFKEQTVGEDGKLGEDYVEQKHQLQVPRNVSPEDMAAFLYAQTLRVGAVRTVGSAGEINLYPIDLFKRFTVKFGNIIGVGLGG